MSYEYWEGRFLAAIVFAVLLLPLVILKVNMSIEEELGLVMLAVVISIVVHNKIRRRKASKPE